MPSRSDRQKVVRKNHVRYIVKRLASKLSTPEHQKRMITTNRILPLGSLKRKVVHQIFAGWVKNKFRGMGRVFTYKLAALVVKRLRDKLDLPECHDIKDEVKKMQYFLKTARKRLGKLPAMSSVDEMVTMPRFFLGSVNVSTHVSAIYLKLSVGRTDSLGCLGIYATCDPLTVLLRFIIEV